MTEKRRVIIHVGMHKTGSTSLQKALFNGRNLLRKFDIVYVGMDNCDNAIQLHFAQNYDRTSLYKSSSPTQVELIAKNRAAEIEAEISNSACRNIIISNEHFCLLQPAGIMRMKEFFSRFGEVHIIYVYREILPWIASFTQELVKARNITKPVTYSEGIRFLNLRPKRFVDVFGRSSVHFLKFEKITSSGVTNALLEKFDLPKIQDMGIEEPYENSRSC